MKPIALNKIGLLFRHPFLEFGRSDLINITDENVWVGLGALTEDFKLGRKEIVEEKVTHIFVVANKIYKLYPTFTQQENRFWKAVHVELARIAPAITAHLDFKDLRFIVTRYEKAYDRKNSKVPVTRAEVRRQHYYKMLERKESKHMSFNDFVDQRVAMLAAIYEWLVRTSSSATTVTAPSSLHPFPNDSARLATEPADVHLIRLMRIVGQDQREKTKMRIEIIEKDNEIMEMEYEMKQSDNMTWEETERLHKIIQDLQANCKQLEEANMNSDSELKRRVFDYFRVLADRKTKLERRAAHGGTQQKQDGEAAERTIFLAHEQAERQRMMLEISLWQFGMQEAHDDEEDDDDEEEDKGEEQDEEDEAEEEEEEDKDEEDEAENEEDSWEDEDDDHSTIQSADL